MLELIGVSADAIGQVDDSVRFAGGEGSSGSVTLSTAPINPG